MPSLERVLEKCTSAEEAEDIAFLEGTCLAAGWTKAPIIFENGGTICC
jgi:hypothetical protein